MKNDVQKSLVVGIGASAGGVEAIQSFLRSFQVSSCILIIIQHLDPSGAELGLEVLKSSSSLPVTQIKNGLKPKAGNIYFAPPRKLVSIQDGSFVVEDLMDKTQRYGTIDWLFNSLAQNYKELSVGIVLSGEGQDGRFGLSSISEAGGMTMAQDHQSAAHPSMPDSASELGVVDYILDPSKMPGEITRYAGGVEKFLHPKYALELQEKIHDNLINICDVLFKFTSHDFKHYKTSTLMRRIQRRMLVLQFGDVQEYIELLQTSKKERDSLFNDLLINVTSFFRDPEAFEALKTEVLRPGLKKNQTGEKYRIWVAGCSTGEEAYSIAILAQEVLEEEGLNVNIQIIATDIDDEALTIARKGEYPSGIVDRVSKNRLEKYFKRKSSTFEVCKGIREMILFSSHNLIHDPPFSQIDLISCRNVLIYLGSHLQKKLFPVFHYSLKPSGVLFLGNSEALTSHKELFHSENLKFRIARRRPTAISMGTYIFSNIRPALFNDTKDSMKNPEEELHLVGQRILLDEFSPRFAIIGEEFQILSVSGGVNEYLEPSAGSFHNNILKLVKPTLRGPLRSALNDAKKEKRQMNSHSVTVDTSFGDIKVMIIVQPMPQLGEQSGLYMVVFKDLGPAGRDKENSHSSTVDVGMVEELEKELGLLRSELDKTVQDLEASNEELKSSNEELLSMNEELQSANEELEISKDEVQKINETLQNNNVDLENLLNSTKIATIFLDEELRIRNFTPAVSELYDLMPHDVGRPINSFQSKAKIMPDYSFPRDLGPDEIREVEVIMPDGKVFLRRKSAYLDKDQKQAGLVVTFVDITELRTTENLFKTLANSVPQMIWSTDSNGNYIYFSQQWKDFTGLDPDTIKNKGFREIIHPDDYAVAIQGWEEAQKNKDYFSLQYRLKDLHGHYHWHLLKARSLKDSTGKVSRWFGTCTNIQPQKELELSLQKTSDNLIRSRERFQKVADAVELGVWYCDLPFDVLEWSETVKRHFFMPPDAVVTINDFYNHIHEEDREKTREAIEESIKENTSYDINYRTINPKGEGYKWIRAIGWTDYNSKGEPIRFDGITLDITEQVESMDRLRKSEWRYSMASKASRELIWDWNLMDNSVIWNDALKTQMGYTSEDQNSNGEWWYNHIHPEDRDRVVHKIHEIIDSGSSFWSDEYRFMRADGQYSYFTDRGFILHDEHKKAIRMIGTMSDITATKLYTAELEQAISARDEFLSIASHELKTPLTSMILQMQMVKRKIERAEDDPEFLHKANELILRQCSTLTNLIDDMLDVSRINTGKLTFNFAEVCLREIVEASLESFSANLEDKNISVKTDFMDKVYVAGDSFRLEQVVYNLLSNALKYGNKKPIHLEVYKEAGWGVVRVSDEGLGISSEALEKIFNRFERAVSANNISGLGLGLYISKEIVEAHEGEVLVESSLGKGSSFTVKIPLYTESKTFKKLTAAPQ